MNYGELFNRIIPFPTFLMCCKKCSCLALVLVIVGALNWGLVGLGMLMGKGADWNVVHMLLGQWMTVEAVVYLLVGLAGLYKMVMCGKCCSKGSCCGGSCCACGNPNCNGSCGMKK